MEDIEIDANDIETIQVSYPDYNGPDDPDANHDCEAMAVDSATLDILLFTKNWDVNESYVYRVPEGSPDEVRLESVIDRSEILRMILFGRTSCRSRSKNNYKILLLTGAQDLLFGQDLLPEQELPNRTESLINNHVELYFACISV